MKEYRVEWTIEIDAPSKEKAAEIAREIQLDRHSFATCFLVQEIADDETTLNGRGTVIDTLAMKGIN